MTTSTLTEALARAEQAHAGIDNIRKRLGARKRRPWDYLADCDTFDRLILPAVVGAKRHQPVGEWVAFCSTCVPEVGPWPCPDYLAHAGVITAAAEWAERHGGRA